MNSAQQPSSSDTLHARAQREAHWLALWQKRSALTYALWPLSWLFQKIVGLRRWAYLRGWKAQYRMPVPVVVVGGIMIGGVGKTPMVAQLVKDLQRAGFQPAIITRGYGSEVDQERRVAAVLTDSLAAEVGDEPLLLQRNTGVPVWVGANRVDTARAVCAAHPECDVIVCDDGLQHYRLYRDLEIAVMDDRGVGNGWCLPAGPLREPPTRLNSVSALVYHRRLTLVDLAENEPMQDIGRVAALSWMPDPLTVPQFAVCSRLHNAYALAQVQRTIALQDWTPTWAEKSLGSNTLMLAGIAQPQVFFDMLANFGIHGERLALPDHAPFDAVLARRLSESLAQNHCAALLMTEKDAVKCLPWVHEFPELAEKIWVVPLRVNRDAGWQALSEHIVGRLKALNHAD